MFLRLDRPWNSLSLALTVMLLSACTAPPSSPNPSGSVPASSPVAAKDKRLKVIATNTVLCDLTRQIAGKTVDQVCLIQPGADPHVYQPTPDDRKAIEEANLILYGGYDFEPSLDKLIKATSNPAPKVAVDETAVPTPQQFEEEGKAVADPHVFHSAQNGIRMVDVIERNLATVDPAHAAMYAQNAKVLKTELPQLDAWIKTEIATIPIATRTLITTHDALGYYSKAYNIPVQTLEGVSTEEKPSATKLKELVETIKAKRVPTIFVELTINPNLLRTVAQEAKVKIADQEIYADGLGEPTSAGGTYQKMLISNTKTIVEGLGGRYTAFQSK